MSTANVIIDSYDAVLFDLDGVVYLGPVAVPGAAEGIAALHDRGTKIGFVTNNAARAKEPQGDFGGSATHYRGGLGAAAVDRQGHLVFAIVNAARTGAYGDDAPVLFFFKL